APQEEQQTPETQAPDSGALDRILSRVNEIGDQVSTWQQSQQQAEPEPEPEPDDGQAILQQLGYEPGAEPELTDEQIDELNLTPQELVELVVNASKQATQAELQRSVEPHLAAQHDAALESAFVDLEGRYPKLLDE